MLRKLFKQHRPTHIESILIYPTDVLVYTRQMLTASGGEPERVYAVS